MHDYYCLEKRNKKFDNLLLNTHLTPPLKAPQKHQHLPDIQIHAKPMSPQIYSPARQPNVNNNRPEELFRGLRNRPPAGHQDSS